MSAAPPNGAMGLSPPSDAMGLSPPSDGAHRLAWWLSHGDTDARLRRVGQAGVAAPLLDRVLTGEVVPDEDARAIAEATGGAVRPEDWARGTASGWTDAPAERTGS